MQMLLWIRWSERPCRGGDIWTQITKSVQSRLTSEKGDFAAEQTEEKSSEGLCMVWSRCNKMFSEASMSREERESRRNSLGSRSSMPWLRWDSIWSRMRSDRIHVIVGWVFLNRKVT